MKLEVQIDRSLIRSGASSSRYAAVSFTAPDAPRRDHRLPVNVALVLDRSGSMDGAKIALAREATEQALRQLHEEDRFALVIYDQEVEVLVESTPATAEAKRRAVDLLRAVQARGSTDLCSGWLRGCEQIAQNAHDGFINRCLLLTDGLANRGVTDRNELIQRAAALRERGVQTSTFGVGGDFDERLLQGMADAGNGHFYFIETPRQIPDLLASELGEALEVVMRQAALEVRLTPGMRAEPLHQFRADNVRPDVVRIELGDLVARQEVMVVVKLQFPPYATAQPTELPLSGGALGLTAAFRLVDRAGVEHGTPEAVHWTFAGHAENDRQPRHQGVDRQVATIYAARARAAATEHNRHGQYDAARRVLTRTSQRIRSYAGADPLLNQLADRLLAEVEEYAVSALAPMDLKMRYYASALQARERSPEGKSKRREV